MSKAHDEAMHRQKPQKGSPQTSNRYRKSPTCYAVWRMARLERRRRAWQAAKEPRVSVCSFRTGDS